MSSDVSIRGGWAVLGLTWRSFSIPGFECNADGADTSRILGRFPAGRTGLCDRPNLSGLQFRAWEAHACSSKIAHSFVYQEERRVTPGSYCVGHLAREVVRICQFSLQIGRASCRERV